MEKEAFLTYNNKNIIGCIPLKDYPQPPDDQQDCIAESCPKCSTAMWVSIRKRNMISNGNYICVCYHCIIKIAIEKGINPADLESIELNRIN